MAIAMALNAVSLGMNAVLFPVTMERDGLSTGVIGIVLSCELVMTVVVCLALAPLLRKLGILLNLVLAIMISSPAIFALSLRNDLAHWVFLLFLIGFSSGVFMLLVQTWFNELIPQGQQGLLLGAFGTAESLGLMLGPVLFGQCDRLAIHWAATGERLGFDLETFAHRLPFALSAALSLLSIVPLLLVGRTAPKIPESFTIKFRSSIRGSQAFMLGTALCGAVYYGISAFIVIYGIQNNMSPAHAALLLAAFTLGSLVLDLPISAASDHFDKRYVFMLLIFLNLGCALFLPLAIFDAKSDPQLAYVLVFIWGGVVGAMYTVCLAVISSRHSKQDMFDGQASYVLMEGIGGTVGALFVGAAMMLLKTDGLSYAITLMSLTYFCYALTRYRVF